MMTHTFSVFNTAIIISLLTGFKRYFVTKPVANLTPAVCLVMFIRTCLQKETMSGPHHALMQMLLLKMDWSFLSCGLPGEEKLSKHRPK